jgi:hypothetical protein
MLSLLDHVFYIGVLELAAVAKGKGLNVGHDCEYLIEVLGFKI